MPVYESQDVTVHRMHGATFSSYVSPSTGSTQLCAWRVEVEPDNRGVEHRLSHEEVFLVLQGRPRLWIDGAPADLGPDQVAFAPAGAMVRLDNPGDSACALFVSTSVGLEAVMADGSRVAPPWAR